MSRVADLIGKANITVESLGHILASMNSKEIYEMINEFNIAEGASVIYDAMELQGTQKIYTQGREKFWGEVTFKKKFLEHLVEIVKFMEEEKKKFHEKIIEESKK